MRSHTEEYLPGLGKIVTVFLDNRSIGRFWPDLNQSFTCEIFGGGITSQVNSRSQCFELIYSQWEVIKEKDDAMRAALLDI